MSELTLETTEQRASYGIGRQMGDQLAQNGFDGVDIEAAAAGLRDAFNGEGLRVSAEDLTAAFNELNQRLREKQEQEAKAAMKVGEEFLAENAKRDGVITLESGLQYEIVEAGSDDAAKPAASDKVRVHYHGTFIDGNVFDSSYQRGTPAEFPVRGVIAGWTEALQLMTAGSKWKLYIPYQLAYGAQGSPGGIPPYSTLVFDVELLDVL
ncbi:FKBP-type peptidyl-prolyl cis-trans isomerase [Marinobacterium lutimaris]|uniref:Peptidyl-prolyl cis-trans isomerase n=1 Tax=Marinobacterium lutimaris TaxID=568106 RepID=A0A1H6CGW0_9GAMM|nr:FKBP-type peptidyl-prolyl cis-trans isomerase [Marinobacterium lutimaris]SEG71596.1 FKBP-type peptidyl-prolyl cis-trans isomerase FklB [Marinobacterium lutimaris]